MAKPNIQTLPPARRYFISYPHHPSHWDEISKYEYRSILACLALGAPDAEGVRVIAMPRELYREPCPPPLAFGILGLMLFGPFQGMD